MKYLILQTMFFPIMFFAQINVVPNYQFENIISCPLNFDYIGGGYYWIGLTPTSRLLITSMNVLFR
jgi:hypothetical protein